MGNEIISSSIAHSDIDYIVQAREHINISVGDYNIVIDHRQGGVVIVNAFFVGGGSNDKIMDIDLTNIRRLITE